MGWWRGGSGRVWTVQRRSRIPFGVYWESDLRLLLGAGCGDAMLDVGANVGETARKLATNFPSAAIYSVEPVPASFAELRRATASLRRVECVEAAFGDTPGEGTVTIDRRARNTMLPGFSQRTARVRVSTVDAFCAQRSIDRLGLLKIDTEGFEMPVLRGSESMLRDGRIDAVLAECEFAPSPDPHTDFGDLRAMLTPYGLRVVSFYTGGINRKGWVWGDVLFVRDGRAEHLPVVTSPFGAPTRPE